MQIFVDADACPVQDEIIAIAADFQLSVRLVRSYSHFSMKEYPHFVEIVYVDKGADMADFEIIKLANKGDIIITQDYGLASLAIGKGCHVMHHKGFMYTKHNIDRLLANRHAGQLARKAGQRTKGPKPFTAEDRKAFETFFSEMIQKIQSNET